MTTFDQSSDVSTAPEEPSAPARRTRWGPAWVGALVALPLYVVLQLIFLACGWMAFGVEGPGAGVAASIVSALLAIIALFVGGLAAGTASSQAELSTGTSLQGVMTWALTALGVFALGLFGGGALAGNLGGLAQVVIATGPQQLAGNPAPTLQAIQAVQVGAGWAALWLGVAVVASVLGTGLGAGLTATPAPGPTGASGDVRSGDGDRRR